MITVINGFQIASDFQSARKGDKVVNFTYNEATALSVLIAYHQDDTSHNYVPKDVLESSIWDSSEVTANSLRKLMSEIRRKLEGSKDVVIIQSIRNKGYKLICEKVEDKHKSKPLWLTSQQLRKTQIFSVFILFTLVLAFNFSTEFGKRAENTHDDIVYHSIFETDATVFGIDYFNNAAFLALHRSSARGEIQTEIVKLQDGHSKVMLSKQDMYIHALSISPHGQVAYMTTWRDSCNIYITNSSFTENIDHISCLGENAVVSLDWENERFLYLGLKMEEGKSSRPFKYDLRTREIQSLTDHHINYDEANGYGTFAIKVYNDAIYTLSIDKNDVITLNVNTKLGQKILYEFTSDPVNFDVGNGKVLLVNERNQFVTLAIPEDLIEDEWTKEIVNAQQSVAIHSPVFSGEFISFVSGKVAKHIVASSHSEKQYASDVDVIDFFQNGSEIALLSYVPNGYKIELYKSDKINQSIYFNKEYMLRQIGVLDGVVYVGGNDGMFRLSGNSLVPLTNSSVNDIAAGNQCLYISSPQGVKKLIGNEFVNVASQGGRVFAFENQCMYEDKVSHNLIAPSGIFGNTRGKEFIFYYNHELAYRAEKEGSGHLILSMNDDQKLGEFTGTISRGRYQSVGSEILFLTPTKSFSRLQRISKNSIL